jgi:hypothetical protein
MDDFAILSVSKTIRAATIEPRFESGQPFHHFISARVPKKKASTETETASEDDDTYRAMSATDSEILNRVTENELIHPATVALTILARSEGKNGNYR